MLVLTIVIKFKMGEKMKNNKICLIGDVHGHVRNYKDIIDDFNGHTIQLGDFGFKMEHDWFLKYIDYSKNKILFGNHEYWPYISNKLYTFGYYSYDKKNDIMLIAGGLSIDKDFRTIGVDYFSEEEMSYKFTMRCLNLYKKFKPRIVLSHSAPLEIYDFLNFTKIYNSSTSVLLSELFNCHEPEQWIFAHYHKSLSVTIKKTKFIGLNTLETYVLNI